VLGRFRRWDSGGYLLHPNSVNLVQIPFILSKILPRSWTNATDENLFPRSQVVLGNALVGAISLPPSPAFFMYFLLSCFPVKISPPPIPFISSKIQPRSRNALHSKLFFQRKREDFKPYRICSANAFRQNVA